MKSDTELKIEKLEPEKEIDLETQSHNTNDDDKLISQNQIRQQKPARGYNPWKIKSPTSKWVYIDDENISFLIDHHIQKLKLQSRDIKPKNYDDDLKEPNTTFTLYSNSNVDNKLKKTEILFISPQPIQQINSNDFGNFVKNQILTLLYDCFLANEPAPNKLRLAIPVVHGHNVYKSGSGQHFTAVVIDLNINQGEIINYNNYIDRILNEKKNKAKIELEDLNKQKDKIGENFYNYTIYYLDSKNDVAASIKKIKKQNKFINGNIVFIQNNNGKLIASWPYWLECNKDRDYLCASFEINHEDHKNDIQEIVELLPQLNHSSDNPVLVQKIADKYQCTRVAEIEKRIIDLGSSVTCNQGDFEEFKAGNLCDEISYVHMDSNVKHGIGQRLETLETNLKKLTKNEVTKIKTNVSEQDGCTCGEHTAFNVVHYAADDLSQLKEVKSKDLRQSNRELILDFKEKNKNEDYPSYVSCAIRKKYNTNENYQMFKDLKFDNKKNTLSSFWKKLAPRKKSRDEMIDFVQYVIRNSENKNDSNLLIYAALQIVKEGIEQEKPTFTSTLWCIVDHAMKDTKIEVSDAKNAFSQFWNSQIKKPKYQHWMPEKILNISKK